MSSAERLVNPYQIYAEISNTGKNFEGSKKKIKWRFGWSNSEKVHEVEFKHSIISGKKSVYEDGREVTSVSNYNEFTHGWQSLSCANHIYRIEASYGLSDSSYTFSIDGVPFNEFPREPVRDKGTTASKPEFTRSAPSQRKAVNDAFSSNDPFESSDPFISSNKAANNTSNFDPFQDDVGETRAKPTTQTQRKPVTTPDNSRKNLTPASSKIAHTSPPSAPIVPAFDGFDDSPSKSSVPGKKEDYLGDLASLSVPTAAPNTSRDIFAQLDDPFAPKAVIIPTASNNTFPVGGTTNGTNKGSEPVLDDITKSLVSWDLNKAPVASSKNNNNAPIGSGITQRPVTEYERNLPLNSLLGAQAPKQAVMQVDPLTMQQQQQAPPMRVVSASEAISTMGARPPMPMMMGGPGGAPPMMGGGLGAPPGYGMQQPMGGYGMQPQPMMGGGMSGAPMMNNNTMYGGGMSANISPRPGMLTPSTSQYGSYGQQQPMATTTAPKNNLNSLDALNWKM